LDQVVRYLVKLAEAHGLGAETWSLGEVLRGEEPYAKLCEWACRDGMPLHKTLCESVAEDLTFRGGRISRLAAYGLALLALACEQGRRHARAARIYRQYVIVLGPGADPGG